MMTNWPKQPKPHAKRSAVLQAREADLSQKTEDVARLAARHQSAHRLLSDSQKTLDRNEADTTRAREAMAAAKQTLRDAKETAAQAATEQTAARDLADRADLVLTEAEAARAETQSREADARAQRSEAEGEMNALSAETTALARLLDRDTAEGGQILDRLQVEQGFEKALGAALADDLRAPEVEGDGPTGWTALPRYDLDQPLPAGVTPLTNHVSVPEVLERRGTDRTGGRRGCRAAATASQAGPTAGQPLKVISGAGMVTAPGPKTRLCCCLASGATESP